MFTVDVKQQHTTKVVVVWYLYSKCCITFSGYVQGMSDLLSPILVVMENEVDAFWCFAGLMERMVSNKAIKNF